ncbi:MAG: PAS domain S-box-containing protein [Myxococcota bacterium]|jgi:PAS domain S-box-containing protein
MNRAKLERLGRLRQEVLELELELNISGAVGVLPEGALGDAAYTLIAQHSQDFISIHAANGDYLFASPASETLLGRPPQSLLGRSAYELFHPDDLNHITTSHAAHAQASSIPTVSYRIRAADGSWLWVETVSHAHTITHESGSEVQQIICITRDISERKLAQDALLATTARLEEFATAVAHDIKGPLTSISGNAELVALKLGAAGSGVAKSLDRIQRSCSHLAVQVDAMLQWARSTEQARSGETADLDRVVSRVLSGLATELESAGADVTLGALPCVSVAPPLVQVLANNLISNAIKYRAHDRPLHLRINAEPEGDDWHLRFTDNGRGIPISDRAMIFEMFRRGRSTRDISGNGVGLAMCTRITELHRGRIWVEDNPGGGAIFHVILPGADQEPLAAC